MVLPTEKTSITANLASTYWLLYGPPGIGKSSLAASFPNAVFATTERAHRHLSIYEDQIKDWTDFKRFALEMRTAGGKRFENIAVDTVDLLYKFCLEAVCVGLGIEHPQDLDYGKGYDAVNTEWQREIVKLSQLGKGLLFISHEKVVEVTARNMKYSKTVPSMANGCHKVLLPFVDIECYLGFGSDDVTKRVAIFEPKENLEAKDRFGKFPREVFLPKDGQFKAIQDAWNGVKPAPKMVAAGGAKKI
jgi:hypothetical protein